MTHSDTTIRLSANLTAFVNRAFQDGATPDEVLDVLAGTVAATAKAIGATNDDCFHMFQAYSYGYRALKPNVRTVAPEVHQPAPDSKQTERHA